jgi:hypothetical protein
VRLVLGDLVEARTAGERAARILTTALGAWHPIVATVQSVTSRSLWQLGEIEAARALVGEVFDLLDRARSKFHPMMAGAWFQSGLLALALGDVARASACAASGVNVGTPAYGPDHPLVLSNLIVSGRVLLEREDLDGADASSSASSTALSAPAPRPHADLAMSLPLLAETQRRGGDRTLARRTVEQGLAASGAVAGDRTQLLAESHLVLGNVWADDGDVVRGAQRAPEGV